jgi:hypothetical protein
VASPNQLVYGLAGEPGRIDEGPVVEILQDLKEILDQLFGFVRLIVHGGLLVGPDRLISKDGGVTPEGRFAEELATVEPGQRFGLEFDEPNLLDAVGLEHDPVGTDLGRATLGPVLTGQLGHGLRPPD